jgi:hypothetical protein
MKPEPTNRNVIEYGTGAAPIDRNFIWTIVCLSLIPASFLLVWVGNQLLARLD